MRILVTGAAGFIGAALSQRLLHRGDQVLGFDNLNPYYDVSLKRARLERLTPQPGFSFVQAGIEDRAAVERAFADFKPARVVNLAAQAGVRTRSRILAPMCKAIWSASSTSWKPAAMAKSGTWSTPRPARSMAPTARCRSHCRMRSITRSACTPPASKRTN